MEDIKKLTDAQLKKEIEDYNDKIESLQNSIEFHDDSFTKENIRTFLYQYQNYLNALKDEKRLRSISDQAEINQHDVNEIVSKFLQEINAQAIFFKDSYPGKMHYEALYSFHASELDFTPSKVYQLYLPFDLENKIITTNYENSTTKSIDAIQSDLKHRIQKPVFIQKVKPGKGRNAFDRNSNPDAANQLKLDEFDLWQGIMYYFFI